jgi:hypothetical protein
LYKSSVFGPMDSRISVKEEGEKKMTNHEVSFQREDIFQIDNIDIEFLNVLLLNKKNLFDIYIFSLHRLSKSNEEKISKSQYIHFTIQIFQILLCMLHMLLL